MGVLGENIEYQTRAVDDIGIDYVFEVQLLRRGQFIIEDDGFRTVLPA